MTDPVSGVSAEAFAALSASKPLLFLDRNANITDTSAKYKSCHGKICDRTVLQGAVGDGYELFRAMCRGTSERGQECSHVFRLDLYCYRYAVLYRLDVCGEAVNVLCLAKNEAELDCCRASNETAGVPWGPCDVATMPSVLCEEDDMSAYEAYLVARGLAERWGRRLTCSKISFSGYADDRSSSHVEGLSPSAFSLTVMSVIKLLDASTDSRMIKICFYGGSAVQMEASTDALSFFGVSRYSGRLTGLLSCVTEGTVPLICAVLAAESAGLTAEAEVCDGMISIVLSSTGAQYPAMDFKFDDIPDRIDKLFDKASVLLSAASDITLPQEGAEGEE
ncbi:MAG: hypothetical protein IJO81_04350 [Clostridia bacterium]|nr:hypothetical protein [Clostridia bacterium]